ncbi:MAG: glycosyltransferase family 1 protein [Patescibacteria group bacterium]
MKIGVDIRVLARGTRTGVEEYTINLLSNLLVLNPKIDYQLFYNAYQKVDLNYPWISLPNVKLNDFKIPNRFFFISARYFNQPKIDRLLRNVDVYFNPHFFIAPVSQKCKKVITFHDLSFEYHPEFFSWRKRLWQKFLMNAKREVQKADKIIAVSESTKSDLINFYKIDPAKIKVIYSGVGEQFNVIGDSPSLCEGLSPISKKYNLPDRFILYFGTIEPRKNLIGLIKAFELLKDKDCKLVIAGTKGWLYQDVFKAVIKSKKRKDIIFTGFVEESDKPDLYNLSELFVYPSFFEGFGFPPLEAMACGIPTIVSSNSSLSEVVGKAALMVDVTNIDELNWAMEIALSDKKLRERLIKNGLEQAQKFSWQKCAKETLNVLIK